MTFNERDVRRTAWEVAENVADDPAVQEKIAKDVANAIWHNLYPEKEPWQKVPKKP